MNRKKLQFEIISKSLRIQKSVERIPFMGLFKNLLYDYSEY